MAEPQTKQGGWSLFSKTVKSLPAGEVNGVYYGPYWGKGFACFTRACDDASAKAWYAASIETHAEPLNLIFTTLGDLHVWLMGLQMLAPVGGRPLTVGRMLWLRAIMKINYLGFNNFVKGREESDWINLVNSPGILPVTGKKK
jgi:hypothetical protein